MWAIITKPFAWLMVKLYELTGNYGVAVILFALVVNLILSPFMAKSKKSMMRQTRIQPQPLRPGGRKPHVRLPVVFPALPHPHRAVCRHPPAHHPYDVRCGERCHHASGLFCQRRTLHYPRQG